VILASACDPDAVAAAFVSGEEWAFNEIRSRLQSKLRRDIRGILHDMPQFVDEVEADTWVTPLMKDVHEAASFKKLYSWLRTIAVNKALDVRRKHSRNEPVDTWEELGLRYGRRIEDPSDPIAFKADLVNALVGMRQRILMVVVLEEIEAEDGLLIDAFERAAKRLGKSTPYVKRIFYELRPLLAIRMPGWERSA
jgi:DNA-directed RNA polymerase specialized sigma24 family protein